MLGMTKQRFAIVVVAVVGMLTTFLPWFKISGLASLAKESVKGTAGDRWITLIVFLAAGVVAVAVGGRDKPLQGFFRYAAVVAGAINLIIGFYELTNGGADAGIYGSADPTWGLWILMLASLALIVVPFVVKEDGQPVQPRVVVQQTTQAAPQATNVQAGSASAASATAEKTDVEKIKELKELLDMGVLTQEEFDKKKDEILG
ncbi:SHOCT domain-containing protein [Weissella confusa]|uniref:SHOCT domain-containing protein n=1 Tax=Weissella fermenti TaxID=2987699 RepID=A0ABT6D2H2_9LACO|nr:MULTISPECIES: SHOCT domain-containing protein [Weissella]MBJ7688506.1 SHOCT domain-containing protein [Weissella confusa]MCW0927265.1 SHOCT domain-containing protein [Weissella sp. LMG 11983]MDF9299706.1 SHOCT domain-containing protein [Weissella sp. BK2]